MSTTTSDKQFIEQQIKQAQDMLGSMPQHLGFAKALYFGRFVHDWILPYPNMTGSHHDEVGKAVEELKTFLDANLDAAKIDREADIPRSLIDGLGKLGVLGATAPPPQGGKGYTQLDYCRLLEEIGRRCSATSIFVNAHHSIGMRALLLFGTKEQQERWLPGLVNGQHLAAFALTEPEAGSDAAGVQTTAELTEDGEHYILNGEKRYITNAAIAQVLTVMAKTKIPGKEDMPITAFLVTPDMPGFEILTPRMDKVGIRGTATGRFRLNNVRVPKENILGPLGKGLRVALTVLDFGRTTFGACCTGLAKSCLDLAIQHANTRKQFGRTLGQFSLVKKKIAQASAWIYAMEAMTFTTANLIDRGLEDFMVETAMLKVWTTEVLWTIVNDTFQIHGGAAYFTDNPLERILRDARINQIGEGANDVLRSFIALNGMRGPAEQLKDMKDSAMSANIFKAASSASKYLFDRIGSKLSTPEVPVRSAVLQPYAAQLGKVVKQFAVQIQKALFAHREEILMQQLIQERVSEVAMEIYASACVLARADAELSGATMIRGSRERNSATAELFLRMSHTRMNHFLETMFDEDDTRVVSLADDYLGNP